MLQLDCTQPSTPVSFFLLPDEILVDILSRLPVKNLILCACSTKWLFSFITTSSFMAAHVKKNGQNPPLFFLKYYTQSTCKEYFSLQPDDDSFTGEFRLFDMPITCCHAAGCFLTVVGSCNGVICLSHDLNQCSCPDNIILWNPTIRKTVTLPGAEIGSEFVGGVRVALGFGFDSPTNDFKVVRLLYRECIVTHTFKIPPVVDVYSLNSNSWRVVEVFGPVYQIHKPQYSRCFVNGAVHWQGWSDSLCGVIMAFNVEDEVFVEINMPLSLANGNDELPAELNLSKCRDMLAFMKVNSEGNVWSVWVMREYGVADSWSELFHIDLLGRYPKPMLFGFRKNEEILIFFGTDDVPECRALILLVGLNRRVTKVLGMVVGERSSFCLDTYVESLALLKEGRAISDTKFLDNDVSSPGEA